MNKSQKIKQFILENQPVSRKDIVEFIIVHVNKRCAQEDYNYNDYRGNYSCGFEIWRRNGHVVSVDGMYSVTKKSIKNPDVGMYTEFPDVRIKRLEETVSYLREDRNKLYWKMRKIEEVLDRDTQLEAITKIIYDA